MPRGAPGALRVLHVLGTLRPSGMERMFVSAAAYMSNGPVQSLILGQGMTHPFAGDLVDAGYEVRSVPRIRTLSGMTAFRRTARQWQPDIIHIHTEGAFAATVCAARLGGRRTPIVRTVHNVFEPMGRALTSRRAQARVADRFVQLFIAVSEDVAANERRFGRDPVVVSNWVGDEFSEVRARRQAARSNAEPVALMVGNPSPIKNHILALRAVRDSKQWRLRYYGDESGCSVEEKAILDDLQRSGRLDHRGTGSPVEAMVSANAFLMPSLHEGMSIALAEAVVAGLPILLRDSPGQQWAHRFDGVTYLGDGTADWVRELSALSGSPLNFGRRTDDLTAAEGAKRLQDIYCGVLN